MPSLSVGTLTRLRVIVEALRDVGGVAVMAEVPTDDVVQRQAAILTAQTAVLEEFQA